MPRALAVLALLLLLPGAAAETVVSMSPGPRPSRVEVETYTTVVWRWDANETHALRGDDGDAWCEANATRCARLFSTVGEYRYHCELHPDERGVVVVGVGGGDPVAPLRAAFDLEVEGLTVRVDASASAESSTAIESFLWEWGDGATDAGRVASHTYAREGDVWIGLTVTDETGRGERAWRLARLVAPDDEIARFEANLSGRALAVEANATGAQTWDFGDGARVACSAGSCTGADAETIVTAPGSIVHVYRRAGAFRVEHAVEGENATGRATRALDVRDGATFDLTTRGLEVRVDASALGAYPPARYVWSFGDAEAAEGVSVAHAFPEAGTWSVELRIQDAVGNLTLARDVPLRAEAPPARTTPAPAPVPLAPFLLFAALFAAALLRSER